MRRSSIDLPAGSTLDADAATALARVFAPTGAYYAARDVLTRHRFCVLSGPPEMGKTAIARMLALAHAANGWQAIEATTPDEVLGTWDPDRRQLFIADDAFGSTEYRPDSGERWALAMEPLLRRLNPSHHLIWTSRPAPLRAGLYRIHRERGAEHFPQPGEVVVAANRLTAAEKALMLLRHGRRIEQQWVRRSLIDAGLEIVRHPHFTPERIRRFATRKPGLHAIEELLTTELSNPTAAMRESFKALTPEYQTVLVALLDCPPSPDLRTLAAAIRRHAPEGLPQSPADLVDRLTDHFLHVGSTGISWVHPSWRDQVIEQISVFRGGASAFLAAAEIDGALLAISLHGGATGYREFPFLHSNSDWDAVGAIFTRIARRGEDHEVSRVLQGLAGALQVNDLQKHGEASELADDVLRALLVRWQTQPLTVELLEDWWAVHERLLIRPTEPPNEYWPGILRGIAERPPGPDAGALWIELAPAPDTADRLEEWLRLVAVLRRHAAKQLRTIGWPEPWLGRAYEIAPRWMLPALDAIGTGPADVTPWWPSFDDLVPEPPALRQDPDDEARLVNRILRDLA